MTSTCWSAGWVCVFCWCYKEGDITCSCQPFQECCQQCQEIVNLSSTTSDNLIRKRHRAGCVSPTRWCAGCTVSPHCAPAGRLVWCYWKGVSPTRTGGDKLLVVSIRVMKSRHRHPLFLPRVSKTCYLGNTTLSKAQCGDSQPLIPPACRRHATSRKKIITQNQEKTKGNLQLLKKSLQWELFFKTWIIINCHEFMVITWKFVLNPNDRFGLNSIFWTVTL